MAKKSQSKPMKEILTRLEEFEYIKIVVFAEDVILKVLQLIINYKLYKINRKRRQFFFVNVKKKNN